MPSPFNVLLLDLNSTFMFGEDRFGPGQSYGDTYREAGGSDLSDAEVTAAVTELYEAMVTIGRTPARYDTFPSVGACLRALPSTAGWGEAELARLEHVVAVHELGHIPDPYAEVVRDLAASHKIGLVSNLWSRKDLWVAELERVGLANVFEWLVFSSDGTSIKPSARIFSPILSQWPGPRSRILMIGDSLTRDVAGAKAAGIKSLWLSNGAEPPPEAARPDFTTPDLLQLPSSGVIA